MRLSSIHCFGIEVNKYFLLIWCVRRATSLMALSEITKVMISFSATSASVERFFSKAGILVAKQEANVDPKTMQMILLVHIYITT